MTKPNLESIPEKPWAILGITRKHYAAARPWKKAGMTRERELRGIVKPVAA